MFYDNNNKMLNLRRLFPMVLRFWENDFSKTTKDDLYDDLQKFCFVFETFYWFVFTSPEEEKGNNYLSVEETGGHSIPPSLPISNSVL